MTCPTCKEKMEHVEGRNVGKSKYSNLSIEHHYRCDNCDNSYIKDHNSHKLRMVDGKDFSNMELECQKQQSS